MSRLIETREVVNLQVGILLEGRDTAIKPFIVG